MIQRLRSRHARRPWHSWAALIAMASLAAVAVVLATFGTADPYRQDLHQRLMAPGTVDTDGRTYFLGSDMLGRDILSRLVEGAKISLTIALVSVLGSAGLGAIIGLASGYFGGLSDRILMRVADLVLAFPFMLLAIAVLAAVGPSMQIVIALFIFAKWPAFARVVRSTTLAVREREFVLAARALGAGPLRIVVRHVAPSVIGPMLILASFEAATVVISEASLGFLGIGVPPPAPTWGNMLATGRTHMRTAWWVVVFPGLAIALTALAANLLGDFLRDRLDPRTRRQARTASRPTVQGEP